MVDFVDPLIAHLNKLELELRKAVFLAFLEEKGVAFEALGRREETEQRSRMNDEDFLPFFFLQTPQSIESLREELTARRKVFRPQKFIGWKENKVFFV